jgi:hypothetical protein
MVQRSQHNGSGTSLAEDGNTPVVQPYLDYLYRYNKNLITMKALKCDEMIEEFWDYQKRHVMQRCLQ